MNEEFSNFLFDYNYEKESSFQAALFVLQNAYPRAVTLEELSLILYLADRASVLAHGYSVLWDLPRICEGFYLMKLRCHLEESSVYDIRSNWHQYIDYRHGKARFKPGYEPYFLGEMCENFLSLLEVWSQLILMHGVRAISLKTLKEYDIMKPGYRFEDFLQFWGLTEEEISDILFGVGFDFTMFKMKEEEDG